MHNKFLRSFTHARVHSQISQTATFQAMCFVRFSISVNYLNKIAWCTSHSNPFFLLSFVAVHLVYCTRCWPKEQFFGRIVVLDCRCGPFSTILFPSSKRNLIIVLHFVHGEIQFWAGQVSKQNGHIRAVMWIQGLKFRWINGLCYYRTRS